MPRPRSRVSLYLVALLAVAAATWLRFALASWIEPAAPTVFFFLAVIVASWYGGLGPGLLATVLSTLCLWFFFTQPPGTFYLADSQDIFALLAVTLVGSLISLAQHLREQALARAWAGEEQATREAASRAEAEQKASQSEQRYYFLVDAMAGKISVRGAEGQPEMFNVSWREYTGRSAGELVRDDVWTLLHPDDRDRIRQDLKQAFRRGDPCQFEFRLRRHDGVHRWHRTHCQPMRDASQRVARWYCNSIDIHDLHETQHHLEQLLRQRDVLLKEVHHRVKNNLQVVISLLRLQADALDDPNLIEVLRECQDRVSTMAAVHESLYHTGDLSQVHLDDYLERIIVGLQHSYAERMPRVDVEVELADVIMSLDHAVLCGLILNELLSNSLEHAFPDDRQGKVRVVGHRLEDGRFCLEVSDNGRGMPLPFQGDHAQTLGLQLVHDLAAQLGGRVDLHSRDGLHVHVVFPVPTGHEGVS